MNGLNTLPKIFRAHNTKIRRLLPLLILWEMVVAGLTLPVCAAQYTIVMVGRAQNSPEYPGLQAGVQRFRDATGHQSILQTPVKAEMTPQIQIIEAALTQPMDALCLFPFSEEIDAVLQRVSARGVPVLATARALPSVRYVLEPFEPSAYGTHLMISLATLMHNKGEFAVLIGGTALSPETEWIEAALAFQKQHYPLLKRVTRQIETYEDPEIAYQKTKELLRAYPALQGILATSLAGVQGAARIVAEQGLQQQVMVIGTQTAPELRELVENGSIKVLSVWNPADLAYALNSLAVKVLDGETIADGLDLGVPGYESLMLRGKTLYGAAWIDWTRDNLGEMP